ncbi:MAG TPA: hypothetical protein VMV73_02665, partial [Candidatus Dormibacteraeota bacterium]|nr:hypothetical protein [Candidatus Dormibacteraeota bacterium]
PPTGFGPPQGSGFGLPQPLEQGAPDPNFGAPFPAPFAMPNAANSAPDPALGWQWEPPDATKGTTETEKPPG